jgi:hypothetical protein
MGPLNRLAWASMPFPSYFHSIFSYEGGDPNFWVRCGIRCCVMVHLIDSHRLPIGDTKHLYRTVSE